MAENQNRSRKDVGKATWLKIFTAFRLAIDLKKLVLAAFGILVTYLGWWILSTAFYRVSYNEPTVDKANGYHDQAEETKDAYLTDALRWSLMYELAGPPDAEIAKTREAWETELQATKDPARAQKITRLITSMKRGGAGRLRGCPWDEYRGPNQFLFASKVIQLAGTGRSNAEPGVYRHEINSYLLFMVEPLCKFLIPVTYFFDSRAGGIFSWNRIYLVLILLWTVATWGIVGGAISRIAAVQLTRNEKVGLREALSFVLARWQGYVFAPVLPLLGLLGMGLVLWFFGLFIGWTFALGDILGGLLWPIALMLGLVMTVVLVGLIGWPLMNATISTEGSDSFDALSRSYSYVFQVPWQYLGYAVAALLYGAALVFFVGFMGTLLVYFGRWGVYQAPVMDSRDPSYLFRYAPNSFEWREVLLKDSPHVEITKDGHYALKDPDGAAFYVRSPIGAYLVAFWLGAFFLLIIGFGYSYFWTASTIIYLLLRQKVDDTDFDEVYLEEDLGEPFVPEPPSAPAPTRPTGTPPPSSNPPGVTFTMVEAPSVRPNDAPAAPPPSPDAAPATPSGNSPPATP